MITNAYSLFDRKALIYSQPFYAPNDSVAMRTVGDACADPNTNLGRHPGDYVLFFVGSFDDQKGALVPLSPLVHIVDVLTLVPAPSPAPLFDRANGVDRHHFTHGE